MRPWEQNYANACMPVDGTTWLKLTNTVQVAACCICEKKTVQPRSMLKELERWGIQVGEFLVVGLVSLFCLLILFIFLPRLHLTLVDVLGVIW